MKLDRRELRRMILKEIRVLSEGVSNTQLLRYVEEIDKLGKNWKKIDSIIGKVRAAADSDELVLPRLNMHFKQRIGTKGFLDEYLASHNVDPEVYENIAALIDPVDVVADAIENKKESLA